MFLFDVLGKGFSFLGLGKSVRRIGSSTALYIAVFSLFFLLTSCDKGTTVKKQEITLYTAVDEPVARPIIAEFEKSTGIHVNLVLDSEATKTAGLADRLEAERDNPQADVFWCNEPFHTVYLAEAGVLAAYESPAAKDIPATYKDNQHRWAGTALRLRVIAASPEKANEIKGIMDMLRPEFRGKIAMASPGIGTTGGHISAIYTLLGDKGGDDFFIKLKKNDLKLVGGNSMVADGVGHGQFIVGLTDNDDCANTLGENGKLTMIIPDQTKGGLGTLLIPCSVSLIKNGPHTEAGKKLVDYLLSKKVEDQLLAVGFAKYPVYPSPSGPIPVHAMNVSIRETAMNMKRAIGRARNILLEK